MTPFEYNCDYSDETFKSDNISPMLFGLYVHIELLFKLIFRKRICYPFR